MSILMLMLGIIFAQTVFAADNGAQVFTHLGAATNRLGRADAAANRVSERVLTSDGQVASSTKVRIVSHRFIR